MRTFVFVAGLIGSALAAPFAHPFTHLGAINKRQAPQNEFTVVKAGTIDDVTIDKNKKNLLEGVYHGSQSRTVNPKEIRASAEVRLPMKLVNNLGDGVKCYIAGKDSEGKVVFLGADGSLIYPSSGGSVEPKVISDPIAISLPSKGQTFDITIPVAFDSGRVYFSQGDLSFYMVSVGEGRDGLVQPSVTNPSDPSVEANWGFVELTLTPAGALWANISYVDFIGIIMSMGLSEKDGKSQEVIGLAADGVQSVCNGLIEQGKADGRPWGAMCLTRKAGGAPFRVVSPEEYEAIVGGGFEDYWTAYVDEVWEMYKNKDLVINTQKETGNVKCRVQGDQLLTCDGDNRGYPKPTAMDIWGCNTGPFSILQGDNGVHLAVVPRLCAAFTRHILTMEGGDMQPGVGPDKYYKSDPTSHYSRVIKGLEVDGKGYTFAYDDITPDNTPEVAGLITSSNFDVLSFYIGGK